MHCLAGLFDNAEDAAVMLAVIKRGFSSEGDGKVHSPLKQNKAHKSRAKPAKPSVPAQLAFEPVQSVARGNGDYGDGRARAILSAECTCCGCDSASDAPQPLWPFLVSLLCAVAFGMVKINRSTLMYVCVHLSSVLHIL
jgi:hypothetical protein